MDRRLQRMAEMMRVLTPFANEAELWKDFPDDQPLVEPAPGFPDSQLTVGHLRAAREAITD